MQIQVRFFAICREIAGCDSMAIELPDGATGNEFWEKLISDFPRLAPHKEHSRLAVNMEYAAYSVQSRTGSQTCRSVQLPSSAAALHT